MFRGMLTGRPLACSGRPNLLSETQVEVLVIDMGSVTVGMRARYSCKARPFDGLRDDTSPVDPGAIDRSVMTERMDKTRFWYCFQV